LALSIGEVIRGKYRLLRLLGDGGMGSVYEASHELLGTRVAIKVLHSDLARRTGLVDRFIQEARVAAQIKSAHVVHVTDVDRTETGVAYIVMELLEGEPLSAMLDRQGKMAIPTACDYTSQILEALEAAHALGVVHRDLKPENVFVTYAAGKPVLKLIDFGIAKLRSAVPGEKSLTVAGVTMGTAEYMAPEQAYSADKVDARSDLYAVGVLLYEMIAAKRPVSGEDARSIAAKVERGEVVPLVHAVPEVPREIAGLVHRAMAPRPELRFASAAEMRIALEAAMTGRRLPTAQTPVQPPTGRTVAGAPMAAAFATGPMPMGSVPMETAPRTERAGPSPMAMTPPPGMATPVTRSPSSPRSRRRGGVSWLWIVMSLLLGGAVVAMVVLMNARDSSNAMPSPIAPTIPTATTLATTTPPALATTPPTATPNAPVAPLNPSPYVPTPSSPRASDGGHAPHTPPATPSANPFPPFSLPTSLPFPLSFDGGVPLLPFPIPTAFPTALPSGFPFQFPTAPSAEPKQPEESPSSSPKTL
jgi:serine/threonine protein kinase